MVFFWIYFIFSTVWGNDPTGRAYFSNGWFNHQLEKDWHFVMIWDSLQEEMQLVKLLRSGDVFVKCLFSCWFCIFLPRLLFKKLCPVISCSNRMKFQLWFMDFCTLIPDLPPMHILWVEGPLFPRLALDPWWAVATGSEEQPESVAAVVKNTSCFKICLSVVLRIVFPVLFRK